MAYPPLSDMRLVRRNGRTLWNRAARMGLHSLDMGSDFCARKGIEWRLNLLVKSL